MKKKAIKKHQIKGRCDCRTCSYMIQDDQGVDVANCHCRTCRASTGGTYVTWATVPLKSFKWTGKKVRSYKSSSHGTRYFCGTCGAQLALFTEKSPETIDVTVATFCHPERYPPNRDIWVSTKLKWVETGLPGELRELLNRHGVEP
jgi:hypothetical protein